MKEGENVCLVLGLTIQMKSSWMERNFKAIFRKNYAYSAAPSISENTFFFYKLTENTDVVFCGDDRFLVLYEAVLHWWAFREEHISVVALFAWACQSRRLIAGTSCLLLKSQLYWFKVMGASIIAHLRAFRIYFQETDNNFLRTWGTIRMDLIFWCL